MHAKHVFRLSTTRKARRSRQGIPSPDPCLSLPHLAPSPLSTARQARATRNRPRSPACPRQAPRHSTNSLPLSPSPALPLSRSLALPLSRSPALPLSRSPALPLSRAPALPLSCSPALPLSRSPALPLVL
ncbi:hypothetical protein CLOP_g17538 [Closterium sp. NIES-67]|nr:hypothetical protein CLOP_g17538 [Closterium sp. NIES-67]